MPWTVISVSDPSQILPGVPGLGEAALRLTVSALVLSDHFLLARILENKLIIYSVCVSVCVVCVSVCVCVYIVCVCICLCVWCVCVVCVSVCMMCLCVCGKCVYSVCLCEGCLSVCFGCMFPPSLQFRKSGIIPGIGLIPLPHFSLVIFRTKAKNAEDSWGETEQPWCPQGVLSQHFPQLPTVSAQ